MIRVLLLATVSASAFAAASLPRAPVELRGEDITHLLASYDPPATGEALVMGSSTRRKSLPAGDVSLMARVLVGEAAGRSDAEVRAIIGVVFNRLRAGTYGARLRDVLFWNHDGVWAFTCLDPVRANGDNVWGAGVTRTREFRRMVELVNDTWQSGANHHFNHYWHPHSMKPAGMVPRWARGVEATRIGTAMFVKVEKGG